MNSIPRYNWPKIRGAEPRQTLEGVCLRIPPDGYRPQFQGEKGQILGFFGVASPLTGPLPDPKCGPALCPRLPGPLRDDGGSMGMALCPPHSSNAFFLTTMPRFTRLQAKSIIPPLDKPEAKCYIVKGERGREWKWNGKRSNLQTPTERRETNACGC